MLNFHPNNHFVREFITDEETQEFLWDKYQTFKDADEFERALISRSDRYASSTDPLLVEEHQSRFCDHVSIQYRHHPELFELSCNLKELSEELLVETPEELWFSQYEFVKYESNGQTFMPHTDDNYDGKQHNRHLTAVTMVEATDDLEGGHLHVWPTNDIAKAVRGEVQRFTVDLKPWESIVFPAWYVHEASPVTKGRRTILISWAQLGYRWHSERGVKRA